MLECGDGLEASSMLAGEAREEDGGEERWDEARRAA